MKFRCFWILTVCPLSAADDPRVEFAFGVLEESRGDEKAAALRFERARELDPLAAELVRRGVGIRMADDDRPGAIALFRDFAGARRDDLGIQLSYADFLTEQGRGDALAAKLAMETLEAALALHPGEPALIRRLCSLDRTRAAEWMALLSEKDPDSVILFVSLSKRLHDSEDQAANAEIERRYQIALGERPGHAALAREASEHFRLTGRLQMAIDILNRHAQAAPWSLDLRVRLGVLNFAAKRNEEGERILEDVLLIDPKRALAHQALAKHFRILGMMDEASFHTVELLKIRGGAPAEYLSLADELLAKGQARQARLLLEHGVFEHPEEGALRVKLAVSSQRDPESKGRCSRLFREAESAFPNGGIKDPDFLEASAEAMIADGQIKAAEERLRAAIRLFPPDAKVATARVLRRLAGLWEAEGRNVDAAKALRQRADGLESR